MKRLRRIFRRRHARRIPAVARGTWTSRSLKLHLSTDVGVIYAAGAMYLPATSSPTTLARLTLHAAAARYGLEIQDEPFVREEPA